MTGNKITYSGRDDRPKLHIDKDLEILAEHHHQISGARLVVAKTKETTPDQDSPYIVAWVAPWQKNIRDYKSFRTDIFAGHAFEKARKKPPPETPSLCRDWQVSKVYNWQDEWLNKGKGAAKINLDHMKVAVSELSKEFNFKSLEIHYEKPKDGTGYSISYYYNDQAEKKRYIKMRDKSAYMVLHELAHVIDHEVNGNMWSNHSPSFIATLIHLSRKYLWHNEEKLRKTAEKAGIKVAPKSSLPRITKPNDIGWPDFFRP